MMSSVEDEVMKKVGRRGRKINNESGDKMRARSVSYSSKKSQSKESESHLNEITKMINNELRGYNFEKRAREPVSKETSPKSKKQNVDHNNEIEKLQNKITKPEENNTTQQTTINNMLNLIIEMSNKINNHEKTIELMKKELKQISQIFVRKMSKSIN